MISGMRGSSRRGTYHVGNIACLKDFDFVFVSVDDGPARLVIVDWLSANGIPFVDCGWALIAQGGGLSGFVRITGIDRVAFDPMWARCVCRRKNKRRRIPQTGANH